jgi:hypothetical protein
MFGKLKQALGVRTVKVALEIPATAEKEATTLQGSIQLTAQSDQSIEHITVRLIEKYTSGRDAERKTHTYELGKIKLSDKFEMKSGNVKEIKFTLPYERRKSNNDQLKEYGGALGALGKLGAIIDAETAEYHVSAEISVKGAVVSPMDHKNIKLA